MCVKQTDGLFDGYFEWWDDHFSVGTVSILPSCGRIEAWQEEWLQFLNSLKYQQVRLKGILGILNLMCMHKYKIYKTVSKESSEYYREMICHAGCTEEDLCCKSKSTLCNSCHWALKCKAIFLWGLGFSIYLLWLSLFFHTNTQRVNVQTDLISDSPVEGASAFRTPVLLTSSSLCQWLHCQIQLMLLHSPLYFHHIINGFCVLKPA